MMPARKPNSSPNTNNHNPSKPSSKIHNTLYQNDWVTMTETTISEEGDIKCTPVPKETKSTSSPPRNVSADNVTSHEIPTPKHEASHEASRHIGSETETGTGFPRYSPGAMEKPPRFLERNECGHDIDIDSDFDINMDMKNNPDDDDDDEYHYTYTYKPNPTLSHPSHPPHSPPPSQSSQSSHIPRTPHSLHTPDLVSFFPALENRDEHFNNYFKNIGFFEDNITIPREPKEPKPRPQSRDTSDLDASRRDEHSDEDGDDKKQNSILENGGSKMMDPCIRIHVDESSQQTSSILHISGLDEDYERDPQLNLYPESDFDTSSVSSSASSEDKVDGC
ncbi:hypothetical protein BCON_0075g00430 [Botryotinia convoluta]|uniref:Uncharacterized protein n=1 Tax=Botryotinia convoluta TaxID=54673 RepID=A0A4Z1IAR0_9HELO|nr:hypothetical protein BCON_0075g00430 [Botryotinia convoluta]